MVANYTVQDFFRVLVAIWLFATVLLCPGYVIGWILNLFDFRLRRPLVRFQIALIVSFGISPILFFLISRFLSPFFTHAVIFIILVLFLIILYRIPQSLFLINKGKQDPVKRYVVYALWVILGWAVFAMVTLMELQLGDRLYYNVVAYDYSTRVAIINAITRTGVPPVNPGYFPGHPVYLTYLYYFWYILCSLVDQLGGEWVDARIAMIASVVWCGLALMATTALYLRLRSPSGGIKIWKSALLGIGLIFVSGADIIPIFLISSIQNIDYLEGDIEHWNEQITAWIGSLSWVPHHVAAMIACLVGVMLLLQSQNQHSPHRIKAMIIAGLAFASAFGLSVFVTIVFASFWGIWMLISLIQKDWKTTFLMLLAGIVGLITISPFLVDLLLGNSGSASASVPFTIAVRSFWPVGTFIQDLPRSIRNLIYLSCLPVNYFLELGFFFIVGLLWLQLHKKGMWKRSPFFVAEIVILIISVAIGSFVRSTVIFSNDIGWRAWLPGQFILLIWGVDIIENFLYRAAGGLPELNTISRKASSVLKLFLIIGVLTTLLDVILLRTWPLIVDSGMARVPNSFGPDTHIGARTLASRQAYEYMDNSLPRDVVIQINPAGGVDRAVGLYANHQIAISVHTAFGISKEKIRSKISSVSKIYEEATWEAIDQSCRSNFINVLVVNDLDKLWSDLAGLEKVRAPLYENQYYAVFSCGE